MKTGSVSILVAALSCASCSAFAGDVESAGITVTHSGAQSSTQGGTQRFTGQVCIDPLFQSNSPSRLSGGMVTFEPGARTAWHTHPLGQTLIVTSGRGWIQEWGQERQPMVAGDAVSIPAGVKHWHGATATTGMTHIALQEALDGKNVNWLEHVTDAQYDRP
ncbi:cupin domain-containing protein [Burkholderia stagnalis]|uniref:(R)-mandelonitrile lyase n=1 Tax=Burkholderia stagnalis TaxID=1503054 RepID=UPI000755F6D8|nr:cupin domain-containing protein [Burkholderia stagnalis]KVM84628.1 cupin [Burkholderia stagnalis]